MKEWFRRYFGLQWILGDNTQAFGFRNLEERIKTDVDQIMKFGDLKAGEKVLDIPCAYGKHVIELATRGSYEAYGLDLNNEEIEVALYRKNRGLDVNENKIQLRSNVKLMVGDMRNFHEVLNDFDLIYNWFWSFGYFSDEENMKTLREFYSALKTNGVLLIQTIPKEDLGEYLTDWRRQTLPTKIQGGQFPAGILNFTKVYDPDNSSLRTTWMVMLANGKILPEEPVVSSVRIYSEAEYEKMFKEVGFRYFEVHPSYFPLKILKGKK